MLLNVNNMYNSAIALARDLDGICEIGGQVG